MSPVFRLTSSDTALVRRTRYGDRGAAKRLATRYLDRVALLASLVGSTPDDAAALAKRGFVLALRSPLPFGEALVEAFAGLAGKATDPVRAQGRLLVLLVDLEHHPPAEAAALLGTAPSEVAEQLGAARNATAPAYSGRVCRGWGLAAAGRALTVEEKTAGTGHVAVCRHCRDRLVALAQARTELLGRSAVLTGAVVVSELAGAALPAATGVAGLLAGKAVIGAVGAIGAVVLTTGAAVAVRHAVEPSPAPPQVVRTQSPQVIGVPAPSACASSCPPLAPTTVPTATPATAPKAGPPGVRVPPLPTYAGVVSPTASLPSPALPIFPPLPGLPLPTVPALPVLPSVPPSTLP